MIALHRVRRSSAEQPEPPGHRPPGSACLLNLLREDGPSTATKLGERTGESSGSTSYHLRQLAQYGFVEPDPGHQGGRERWWRASTQSTSMEASTFREAPVEAEAYLRAVAGEYADRVARWLNQAPLLAPAWDEGATLSNWRFRLTPAEADQMLREFDELVARYRRERARHRLPRRRAPRRPPGPAPSLPQPGRCLVKRSFVGLMAAEAISLFGSRMTFVALPWLVLITTGSATRTGVAAFAEMLPYVLASAVGGPLVDRIGARRVAIAADTLSVAVVAGIPILYRTTGITFGVLIGLFAVAGLVRAFGDTGKRVVFSRAVADSGVPMTRATSIHDGVSRAATLIGAPLSGILIAATDAPTVLYLDAASFAVSALLVAGLVRISAVAPVEAGAEPGSEPATTSYWGQLREGVSFVRRDKLVLGIVLMLFVTNLLDQAFATVFVPVWARDIFGSPAGLGISAASFAAGAVIGNVIYTLLATRLPRYATFAIGFLSVARRGSWPSASGLHCGSSSRSASPPGSRSPRSTRSSARSPTSASRSTSSPG